VNPSPLSGPAAANAAPRGPYAPAEGESGSAANLFASLLGCAAVSESAPSAAPKSEAGGLEQAIAEQASHDGEADPALGVLLALGLEPLPPPPPLGASLGLLGAALPAADTPASDADAAEPDELTLAIEADAPPSRLPRPAAALAHAVASALAAQAAAEAEGESTPSPTRAEAGLVQQAIQSPPRALAESDPVDLSTAQRAAASLAVAAQGAGPEARSGASKPTQPPAAIAVPATAAVTTTTSRPQAGAEPSGALDPRMSALPENTATTQPRPARAGADFSASVSSVPPTAQPAPSGEVVREGPSLERLLASTEPRLPSRPTSASPLQAAASGLERAELASLARDPLFSSSPLHPALPARLDPSSAGFTGVLAQQVAWQAETKLGRAEIRLEPEELGPMDITVELDGDEIRAEFGSRSAEVRALLESQVPKLRELLAEQGFSLADAQVGQERAAYSDAQAQREGFDKLGGRAQAEADVQDTPAPLSAPRARLGLVDDYA
jgi:flagellar hook-length control protein FliK